MTRQHSIDLLPQAIQAQSQAGLRMGRFGAASAVVIVMLVVAATHSRFVLHQAQMDLFNTSAKASNVLEIEAKAAQLRKILADTRQFIDRYGQAAYPLDMSVILASVVHSLPPSVTLDQVDLNAGAGQPTLGTRSKGMPVKGQPGARPGAPRVLKGEISGFAASDEHIAELVSRLDSTPPFKGVSLDFTRTREVRGQSAREFRLSFRIDLEATYKVEVQKSEVEDQRSGVRSQKSGAGGQKSATANRASDGRPLISGGGDAGV